MITKVAPTRAPFIATGLATMVLGSCAGHALADIEVRFIEGAPKDRFELRNAGDCAIEEADVVIDLSGSAGALVFDVTADGAGVEVFQPFEVVEGAGALAALPDVQDGDTAIALAVTRLGPNGTIAFTTDVDDTLEGREITVTDGEIEGAAVRVTAGGMTSSGAFTGTDAALIRLDSCVSR